MHMIQKQNAQLDWNSASMGELTPAKHRAAKVRKLYNTKFKSRKTSRKSGFFFSHANIRLEYSFSHFLIIFVYLILFKDFYIHFKAPGLLGKTKIKELYC